MLYHQLRFEYDYYQFLVVRRMPQQLDWAVTLLEEFATHLERYPRVLD